MKTYAKLTLKKSEKGSNKLSQLKARLFESVSNISNILTTRRPLVATWWLDAIVFVITIYYLGVQESTGKEQPYRPAYLDHFEKLEQQNQLNMAGNKRMKENVLKGDANQHFPGKFLGPIDFEFVSLSIILSNSELCFLLL